MTDNDKPLVEVELFAMAYGGDALGRHEGRVVFIPYTLPGEVVEAEIVEERGRVAFGRGVRLLTASADRDFPACKHFGPGKCGACQWQHIDYEAQILLKQDVLADQLERVGGFKGMDVRPVIPAPQPWGYNDHMTFKVSEDGGLGFSGVDVPVFPVEVCEVLHPALMALYEQLDINTTDLDSVKLMRGTDGEQMIVLRSKKEETPELELDVSASINLLLPDNAPINLAGNTHVHYEVAGRRFRVTAGSAFRQNTAAVSNLVAEVLDAAGNTNAVLDLYAGVGLFGAFLAEQADYVTLVESYPPAATDADENTADFENVDIIEGAVEDVLAAAQNEYDTAIVDPPPDGVSVETLDALGELTNIKTLVYVSNDVATFARDGKRLRGHGFELERVQPLDLAPQTYYTEVVGRFVRH